MVFHYHFVFFFSYLLYLYNFSLSLSQLPGYWRIVGTEFLTTTLDLLLTSVEAKGWSMSDVDGKVKLKCMEAKTLCLKAATELDSSNIREAKEKIWKALSMLEELDMKISLL